MNQAALTISVVVGTLAVIGVIAFLIAVTRTTAQEKRIERLQSENEDYIRRLDYVEPRLHTLEQQNSTLMKLHDPTDQIASARQDHKEILAILRAQGTVLAELEETISNRFPHQDRRGGHE